jgi:hypothetical protein
MLTEERINQNYLTFIKKLETYNCYSEKMMNEIGEKIKHAPYSMNDEHGGCYDGALIETVLFTLCRIGFEMNENAFGKNGKEDGKFSHPFLAVNTYKLMRVLLLSNIAKAVFFETETEQWKQKRGLMYRFIESDSSLNLGEKTLYLCQKYGIKLDEDEYEAIISSDKDDENGIRYRTPLYVMVKAVTMFAMVELRRKWMSEHQPKSEKTEK